MPCGGAFAGEHLGERHAGRPRHRGRRARGPRRLGAGVEHVDDAPPALRSFICGQASRVEADRGEQLEVEVLLPLRVGYALRTDAAFDVPALFTRISMRPNA